MPKNREFPDSSPNDPLLDQAAPGDEPAPEPEPAAEPEPVQAEPTSVWKSTLERLRAFEDKVFGPNHPRINDQIERGIGSMFSRLDPKQKAHHAALEDLIEAEDEHRQASEAADVAAAKLKAAADRADKTEEDANG